MPDTYYGPIDMQKLWDILIEKGTSTTSNGSVHDSFYDFDHNEYVCEFLQKKSKSNGAENKKPTTVIEGEVI